jgi:hypothetical protein
MNQNRSDLERPYTPEADQYKELLAATSYSNQELDGVVETLKDMAWAYFTLGNRQLAEDLHKLIVRLAWVRQRTGDATGGIITRFANDANQSTNNMMAAIFASAGQKDLARAFASKETTDVPEG